MIIIKRFKKICSVVYRTYIHNLMYVSSGLYMKKYIKYLRNKGMDISGMPNYISNDVHFDGKDYSIIHLGNGCTISREVLFLTHDYSRHTVLNGLKDNMPSSVYETLKIADGKNKLLDLRGIYIGDNTFIGARTLLLPGAVIGNNCIVGGGSVVKGKFGDNSIIFGNPAREYKLKTDKWLVEKAKQL